MYLAALFSGCLAWPRHDSLPRSLHLHGISKVPGYLILDSESWSVAPLPQWQRTRGLPL